LSREVLEDLNLIISKRPHLLAEDHDRVRKARFFAQSTPMTVRFSSRDT